MNKTMLQAVVEKVTKGIKWIHMVLVYLFDIMNCFKDETSESD